MLSRKRSKRLPATHTKHLQRGYLEESDNASLINHTLHPSESSSPGEYINALQIVHDAFYYMGFMQLSKFMVFLAMGIVMLLFHVSTLNNIPNTAYFRMSITNQLSTGYELDNQTHLWKDVDSFYAASEYYKGFLQSALEDAEDRQLPDAEVRLGEYGEILHARIVVNFEENCELQKLQDSSFFKTLEKQQQRPSLDSNTSKKTHAAECWHNTIASARDNSTESQTVEELFGLGKSYNLTHPGWHTSPYRYFSVQSSSRGDTDWQVLIVMNKEENNTQLSRFKDVLENGMSSERMSYMGRYAYSIGLDIIAVNTMNRFDYAIFSLRAQRSGRGTGNIDAEAFRRMSSTTPGKRYIYTSHRDGMRKYVEVVFWCAYFWVVGLDFIQVILALRQGHTLFHFMHCSLWNVYNWATNTLLFAWLVWYFVLYTTWDKNKFPQHPNHCVDFYYYEKMASYYLHWVFFGIGCILMVGLRVLQFSRLHAGVNVFHDVFTKTIRDLVDFFMVFVFTLSLFGTCVFLVFQLNGGNPNWVTWEDGISVLSRLAFQYSSYEEIYNDGVGAGKYGWVITCVFWLSIVVLFVFAGNIFLSAVAYAYQAVRDKNPQVEVFLVFEIMYRIAFFFAWIFWMLIGCHFPNSLWERFGCKIPPHRRLHHDPTTTAALTSNPATDPKSDPASPPPADPSLPRLPAQGLTSPARALDIESPPPPLPLSSNPPLRTVGSGFSIQPASGRSFRDVDLDRDDLNGGEGGQGNKGGQGEQPWGAGGLNRQAMQGTGLVKTLSGNYDKGKKLFRRLVDAFHRADSDFYLIFFPSEPSRYPRWYLLSRWALASRPEMKALATYFIDFSKFRLKEAQGAKTSQHNALNPMNHRDLIHLPFVGERQSQQQQQRQFNGDWQRVELAELEALLSDVRAQHSTTLEYCSIPVIFPRWLPKFFLGYFWDDYTPNIPRALSLVYHSKYMQQIESSFNIDEDEEMALVTIADLNNNTATLKADVKADVEHTVDEKLKVVMDKLERLEALMMQQMESRQQQ